MLWNELLKVDDGQLLILEIGANVKPQAKFVPGWEGAKVLTLDVDEKQNPDIVANAALMPGELHEKLDGLLASHVLEHFSYWKTEQVLKGWVECLKPGGELHILVPSLEWAARQVLSESPSPALYAQLYAGQVNEWDEHLTGFTMRKLRQLFDKVGVSCRVAKTAPYHVRVGSMGEFPADQHYVAGVKGEPILSKV